MLSCKLCNKSDFDTPWFQSWRASMASQCANGVRLGGAFLHRKEWEFIAVSQALYERGMLSVGKRGLGFAVGREPLPSLFANRGCRITATDYINESEGAWKDVWASQKSDLYYKELCSLQDFEKSVTYQRVDMNAIPRDLAGYDFSWSCCALEHLGSLERGLAFIKRQLDCLVPGGIAVNTTEYNLLSNDHTVVDGPTVVYRARDIARLQEQIVEEGNGMEPFDATYGQAMEDWFVAHAPWQDTTVNLAHLRLLVGRQLCTSVLLICSKGSPS